ncbi:MAG: HNH endonuclease [Hyphomonadaceae bacterium]
MSQPSRDYTQFPAGKIAKAMGRVQVDPNSGCWLWDGATSRDGYAVYTTYPPGRTHDKTAWYVHRAFYTHMVAVVPSGIELDHKCRTKCCVNPAHLEPVTSLENKRRSPSFGIHKTHCPKGHEYTPDNVKWIVNAKYRMRGCRTCINAKQREKSRNRTRAEKDAHNAQMRVYRARLRAEALGMGI